MQGMERTVDYWVDRSIQESFEAVDERLGKYVPSEVEAYLERAWGLGEMWRDWWVASGDEYF